VSSEASSNGEKSRYVYRLLLDDIAANIGAAIACGSVYLFVPASFYSLCRVCFTCSDSSGALGVYRDTLTAGCTPKHVH